MSENSVNPNPLGLGEEKIVARIFFCNDILDDSVCHEIGSRFFHALLRAFPDHPPLFHALDSSWPDVEIEEIVDKEAPEKNEALRRLSAYLRTEWPRREYNSIWLKDTSIHVEMRPPPRGGSYAYPKKGVFGSGFRAGRLRRYYPTVSTIDLCIPISQLRIVEWERLMRFLRECFLLLEGSYGFISPQKILPSGNGRLELGIPGIFWVNLFGPDYVAMIGRDRFLDLENVECDTLEDGSVWLKVTEDWREQQTRTGRKKAAFLKRKLGSKWFRSSLIENRWFPRLRNLRIVDPSEAVDIAFGRKSVRDKFGYPPKMRDFLSVSQDDDGVYALWVDEFAGPYLGEEIFWTLGDQFSQIPGKGFPGYGVV
jgi:hypothetical protein